MIKAAARNRSGFLSVELMGDADKLAVTRALLHCVVVRASQTAVRRAAFDSDRRSGSQSTPVGVPACSQNLFRRRDYACSVDPRSDRGNVMKDLKPNFVQIVQLTDGNLAAFNGTVTENNAEKARVQRLVLRFGLRSLGQARGGFNRRYSTTDMKPAFPVCLSFRA